MFTSKAIVIFIVYAASIYVSIPISDTVLNYLVRRVLDVVSEHSLNTSPFQLLRSIWSKVFSVLRPEWN